MTEKIKSEEDFLNYIVEHEGKCIHKDLPEFPAVECGEHVPHENKFIRCPLYTNSTQSCLFEEIHYHRHVNELKLHAAKQKLEVILKLKHLEELE
jgi:hypothetical protein